MQQGFSANQNVYSWFIHYLKAPDKVRSKPLIEALDQKTLDRRTMQSIVNLHLKQFQPGAESDKAVFSLCMQMADCKWISCVMQTMQYLSPETCPISKTDTASREYGGKLSVK